jgi:hypothetical protein
LFADEVPVPRLRWGLPGEHMEAILDIKAGWEAKLQISAHLPRDMDISPGDISFIVETLNSHRIYRVSNHAAS